MLLRDLLKNCETGDDESVRILVQRFRPWALEFARAILDDRDLAEDVVQEAFMTALGRLNTLREPDAFPGWFRQIIRSQAGRILRKRRELPTDQEDHPADDDRPFLDHLQTEELRAIVRDALQSLSSAGRDTAELFYLEDMSCAGISDILGVPEGTVKRRLFDARAQLRDMLLGYIRDDESEAESGQDPGFPL